MEHILIAIEAIEKFMKGLEKGEFKTKDMEQSAVIRQFEIIGEAANNVSPKQKLALPNIPWREAISMRNFVVHDYFRVDYERVWDTLQKDIPKLKRDIKKILKD